MVALHRQSDIAGAVLAKLGAIAGDAGARRFAQAFVHSFPPPDLEREDPADLAAATLGLWRFFQERRPGTPSIRVFNPTAGRDGWDCAHTVVEIVNDDMRFLVDSVRAALVGLGLSVHLVVHPILRVHRDRDGRLIALAEGEDGGAESAMQVRIDQESEPATHARIAETLARVLADVRAAVADWQRMRDRAGGLVAELKDRPPPVSSEETAEAVAFLEWLMADHFTFLGCRDYAFAARDGATDLRIVSGSGLGILTDDAVSVFEGTRQFAALPPDAQAFMREQRLVMATKANRRSTVHRPSRLDVVIIQAFAADGTVAGERMFVGLFTSVAYSRSPREIPYLRRKVAQAFALSGLDPNSHDGKALGHILDTYPRDELFQIDAAELLDIGMGILHLQDRQRTGLFVRRDPYERFVSALVYVPRDRYSTALRERFETILERAYGGEVTAFYVQLSEGVHARVHFIVATPPGDAADVDRSRVEADLAEAARSFGDRLREALVRSHGEEAGLDLWRRYGEAFPTNYREQTPLATTIADIGLIEQAAAGAVPRNMHRPQGAQRVHFKLYRAGQPVPLSDVLPMLEHMGLRVIAEVPYEVRPAGAAAPVWIHDFEVEARSGAAIDAEAVAHAFHDAFARVWSGEMEDDGFNRLVLGAGVDWRRVVILRAYAKYLRQAQLAFSQGAVEETLAKYPAVARLLADLFAARFDPAAKAGSDEAVLDAIGQALDQVDNLDEDRILRRLLNLVQATLRTNFYQPGADGGPKPWLALKLDSRAVEGLPLPRPWREVFVYSPRVEAVHLRGGPVARGGIRWSDRREDFRTEILGLMKAQTVKNAVIVPVGSKGGFVLKRPPAGGGRDAIQAEAIACYQTFMRGLLDVTDNLVDGKIVPPPNVVRRDGDDAYLVVAADKGTATFSDIANAISRDYGFWLDDAFASGGSAGYDHKKMGITARGAWESVRRHFRELGRDIQSDDFTVVGVGDMAGDVFGNAMLLSPHIRLVGAFNHLHIFVDPNPDAARSFTERQRLFALGRGSWDQYDAGLISPGGGVFERRAKSLKLSPEIRARFGIQAENVTPAELIGALLRAETDLLWFGGIGTFVKKSAESHGEVGDKANDALRIDGSQVRALVVGEGANLAVTQRGRIQMALKGVRLNTDFIDNSAGVDTSDHEVNIKILLGPLMAAGAMTLDQRNQLLAAMTDEVAALVLRDNYLQTQALSVVLAEGPAALDGQARLMRGLERAGSLDRVVEQLPSDDELAERAVAKTGLTRPELAVLLAYAKMSLYDAIVASPLPDEPALATDLAAYFPKVLAASYGGAIARHPLRREIVATQVTNALVNRAGPTFVAELMDRSGAGPVDVVRAFLIARAAFDLEPLWVAIEALDGKVPAALQIRLHGMVARLVERAVAWLLRRGDAAAPIAASIEHYRPGLARIAGQLEALIHDEARAVVQARAAELAAGGVPAGLARHLAGLNLLATGLDLICLGQDTGADPVAIGRLYFELGRRLGIAWLRDRARGIPIANHWEEQALAAIVDDLNALQAELAARALAEPGDALETWLERRRAPVERTDHMIAELKLADQFDLAMLAVANRRLRALAVG